VAEDVRALARSLANDFRDVFDQARRGGQPTGQAVRHGLRGVADQVSRDLRAGLGGHHRHDFHRGYYYGPGWRGRPPWAPPPPPPGVPGSTAGTPGAGPPQWQRRGRSNWGPPGSYRPPRQYQPRPKQPRPPRPPVRHRWDATTVLGLLAVLFGVAWLLGAVHIVHVSVAAVLAIGLMLLGASLIVTGRTDWSLSRKSWPVWLGAGMVVALVATSSAFGINGALQDVSFGNVHETATAGQTVHGGFGNVTVDASKLAPGDTLAVDSVAGQTFIQDLPANAKVIVNARVLGGQICVNGQDVGDGVSASVSGHAFTTPPPSGSSQGTTEANATSSPAPITLNVHQVFGQILVGDTGCSR
jgi:hypothetical protein